MTAGLKKSQTQLEEYNKTLEQKVEERTRELKQTQAQLVQSGKLAAIGQLGAGVAHELNNPVGGILGYAQYLLEKVRKPDFKAEDFKACEKPLGYIEKEAQRCKTIVENLLKFSRRSPEKFATLNINQVIEDTLAILSHQLMMKKIEVKKGLASGLRAVEGNANQLQQVFTNIILNAQQAMPHGGELSIITKGKDDRVEVRLSDTGCGIPPENRDKIFDPFFTTKIDWKGTGLGLSVSYEIVQNHQGRIGVESQAGRGTTFIITLPVADAGL
jgi:two-component system NtrC family sensor kinase